jgi:hypothetical protein
VASKEFDPGMLSFCGPEAAAIYKLAFHVERVLREIRPEVLAAGLDVPEIMRDIPDVILIWGLQVDADTSRPGAGR